MITPIEALGSVSPIQRSGTAAPGTISSIAPIRGQEPETQVPELDGGLFASVFQNAIQNVKETDAENVQAQYLLSTGQLDNPAAAMIAATKYSISVDMLVQFRNKALDAYSELTRMSI